MQYYTYPLAYAPGKVALALAEKHITPAKQHVVDLFNGQSLNPAFLKLNPAGTVPVLVDGSTTLKDSKDIVVYLDNKDGKPLGSGSVDAAAVARWTDKVHAWDGNLFVAANTSPGAAKVFATMTDYRIKYAQARAKEHPDLAAVYEAKIASMQKASADGADPSKGKANWEQLVGLLDEAELQLASTPFLAGQAYSAADVMFTPVLFRLGVVGKTGELLKPRPNVGAYFNRMKQRPSFKAAFGQAASGLTAARYLLPAVGWASLAKLTGRY